MTWRRSATACEAYWDASDCSKFEMPITMIRVEKAGSPALAHPATGMEGRLCLATAMLRPSGKISFVGIEREEPDVVGKEEE